MPGHKLGKGIPQEFLGNLEKLDLTEIPGMDNLHYPYGIIREALQLAATAFGADETYFLVNGSTCGILAAVLTLCKPGDTFITVRDCHKSVISGMMLAGANPVYINPEFLDGFGISSAVRPASVRKAVEMNPDAAAVLITRPNYYGICPDIKEIASIVHEYKIPLIVDEAHGAHLHFNGRLPESAMAGGADISIQSAHKTLPALNQGAYLHLRNGLVDSERLQFNLELLQTSSPSYIIMAFLDIARAIMQENGRKMLDDLLDNILQMKMKLNRDKSLSLLEKNDIMNGQLDDTRIVVNFGDTLTSGFEAERLLRLKYNIQAEMSDLYNVVFITTVADTAHEIDKLLRALNETEWGHEVLGKGVLGKLKTGKPFRIFMNRPDVIRGTGSLKDIMHKEGRWVLPEKAVGRTCIGMITPYPPGTPLLCPGEEITLEAVCHMREIIDAGGVITGLNYKGEIKTAVY